MMDYDLTVPSELRAWCVDIIVSRGGFSTANHTIEAAAALEEWVKSGVQPSQRTAEMQVKATVEMERAAAMRGFWPP